MYTECTSALCWWKWSQLKLGDEWTKADIRNTVYINKDLSLKVTFSNKYIPFEEVVITSKESNKWEYRPAADGSSRLNIQFDWEYEDSVNTLLSVKTIVKHNIIDIYGNLVITLNG